MFNPRTALVLVAPLVCAALVACRASVGEEVRITGESERGSSASSDPAAPAEPSQAHSDPVLVPEPSDPTEPSGGAASEQAPATADASVDAGADVAPPKPTYSCTAPTMWSSAPTLACAPREHAPAAGTFAPGAYYLSQWWTATEWICTDKTRSGTMNIEVIDGITYMRWNIPGRLPGSGTFRLTTSDTTVVRQELCSKLGPATETLSYTASSTEIVLTNAAIQETWKRVPKTLDPKFPVDPITK